MSAISYPLHIVLQANNCIQCGDWNEQSGRNVGRMILVESIRLISAEECRIAGQT